MGDTMTKAEQRWTREVSRTANWQAREDYRQACQAAHAWAVKQMGAK